MPGSLFDTNILIDYLRGFHIAEVELSSEADRRISIVTWMEVLAGPFADDGRARLLLMSFVVLPLTDEIAAQAAQIRRETRMKLLDAIILATARVSGLLLVTRNTKDFPETMAGVRVPYVLPSQG